MTGVAELYDGRRPVRVRLGRGEGEGRWWVASLNGSSQWMDNWVGPVVLLTFSIACQYC